jgi:hypothetical protein
MPISVPSDTVSSLGRAAHDVGLASLLGGNLYARLAMHPALREVGDERQRGAVVNRAWHRYGTVNALGLAAVLAGWAGARAGEAQPQWLSERERRLARAKDVAVATVAVTGLAAAAEGVRFNRMAPGGAVPLRDGSTPSPSASPEESSTKHVLNALGTLNGAAALALVVINSALAQTNFRRPPARRFLRRRY